MTESRASVNQVLPLIAIAGNAPMYLLGVLHVWMLNNPISLRDSSWGLVWYSLMIFAPTIFIGTVIAVLCIALWKRPTGATWRRIGLAFCPSLIVGVVLYLYTH